MAKLLGSYMCSSYDIHQRCILGNLAFQNYRNIWLQGVTISLSRLIQVYEAMVVSIIMYNCASWAVPNDILNKLDICHRKHLRQILKIKYPNRISNVKLYTICSTKPLSARVKIARWRMFGHVLRSPENTPAALALHFAVVGSSIYKGRRGRHQTNLLSILRNDISRIHMSDNVNITTKITLKCGEDIDVLRSVASERKEWEKLFNYVV